MPTILITGGHSGIGFECVKHLASQGYDIVMLGRDNARMGQAATAVMAQFEVKISTVQLDVASLQSVREAAAKVREMIGQGQLAALDAIICNAGATFRGEPSFTDEGHELTFATNYLGHFLLVQLLLDSLADQGRIVFTASGTHDPDTADGKFIGRAVRPNALALSRAGSDGADMLPGGRRYTTSKLCVVLHAYELDRRLTAAGLDIATIAYDPGAISETGLLRDVPAPARFLIGSRPVRWLMKRAGLTIGDLVQSGRSLADLASSRNFASGRFYQWKDGALHERRSAEMSYDRDLAQTLWQDTKVLVHLRANEEPARLR